jgi:hypothetical protein
VKLQNTRGWGEGRVEDRLGHKSDNIYKSDSKQMNRSENTMSYLPGTGLSIKGSDRQRATIGSKIHPACFDVYLQLIDKTPM